MACAAPPRAEIAAQKAAWHAANRAAHPEKMKALRKARYQIHRAEAIAASMAWRADNPEKHREQSREQMHRRRVRLLGGFVERVDLAVLVERDGGRCGICRKKVSAADASIDHVLPVSKGGAHSYANCRLVHLRCNIARGNRGSAQLRLEGVS